MNIVQKLLKGLFWILIIVLLLAPLWLIYQISLEEIAQYETPEIPVLLESSIGMVREAVRMDIREYITVSGVIRSGTYEYMEVDYGIAQDVRWYVSTGDEIQEGQCIASGPYGEIVSTTTGIIKEMHTYSADDCYIKVLLFAPLELECAVPDTTLSMLKLSKSLRTPDEAAVTLNFVSRQKNADGTTTVRIGIESDEYTFGEYVSDLRIYTGRVYQSAIALPVSCVYQKSGSDQWYVRQVSKSGIFIDEIAVSVGYSDGTYVSVVGVNEGDYFDSGYKLVAEG